MDLDERRMVQLEANQDRTDQASKVAAGTGIVESRRETFAGGIEGDDVVEAASNWGQTRQTHSCQERRIDLDYYR